ncbi:MAG: creatininase family protein, partial [Polyangiales bacterium]
LMSESGRTIPVPAGGWQSASPKLAELSTDDLSAMVEAGPAIVLVPIGSTEPHGPHLPLATDAILSDEACLRAARTLRDRGTPAVIAPTIPYGVTHYAQGFRGAIGVREDTLVDLLVDVGRALLDDGFAHVSFVNNHLEPEHVAAIEKAVQAISDERGPACISFPNQLSKRWGRTLTEEFKRGDCHAGSYETSLVLAARGDLVRQDLARDLPKLSISLSEAIRAARGAPVTFAAIGMNRAYTGAPAEGSREEGERTYGKLVEMIVSEITERMAEEGESTTRGAIPTP